MKRAFKGILIAPLRFVRRIVLRFLSKFLLRFCDLFRRIIGGTGSSSEETLLSAAESLIGKKCFVQQFDSPGLLSLYPGLRLDSEKYSSEMHKVGVRDVNRVVSTCLLLDLVKSCEGGNYIEVGTYQGNFARIIQQRMVGEATLFCLDTFEGFEASDAETEEQVTGNRVKVGHYSDTDLETVARTITAVTGTSRLKLIKGHFPSSFAGLEHESFRFVHLDVDLYEPTRKGIEILWPRIVPGGLMLIHDYNALYEGIRKAVDDYFLPVGIAPLPLCDKSGSVVIVNHRAFATTKIRGCLDSKVRRNLTQNLPEANDTYAQEGSPREQNH